MKNLLSVLLILLPQLAFGQWSNGLRVYPTPPIAIGSEAHGSISFGVRCLSYTDPCNALTGAGQRGISSEAIYNSQATVYVAGIHSLLTFAPGSYTVPQAYRIRATDEAPFPDGVVVTNLYGLRIYDVIRGQFNYAIYTEAGEVSLGDKVTIRNGPLNVNGAINATSAAGTRSINVKTGSILSFYDANGVETARLQGASTDTIISVLSGALAINGGSVRIQSLSGSGTRAVLVQADGTLIAP